MKISMLALLAAAGLAAPAVAQPSLYLIKVSNLDPYANATNPFYVGSNPRGGVLVRQTFNVDGVDQNIESLFITGFNNTGATVTTNVVKIEDVLEQYGPRASLIVPNSTEAIPAFRGYTGMDYRKPAGNADVDGGLVVNWENVGSFGPTQARIFDVDSQHNPILLTSSPNGTSFRGTAGSGWDMGFGGQGFTVGANAGRPVVAILDFTSDTKGPFGANPNTLDGSVGTEIYNSVGGGGILPGPVLNTADPFGFTVGGTIWRDIDIHPDTGMVVARSFNDVVIANRNADNTAQIVKVIDGPSDLPANNPGFQVAQECAIMHGFYGGDLIAWNSRVNSNAGQPLGASLRFADPSGNPVTVQLLDPDTDLPTTELPADGNGMLGIFWDRGMLVVVDGSSGVAKAAYIFKQCLADVNSDGIVDLADFFDFFNGFDLTTAPADINLDGSIDLIDFFLFLNKFDQSC
jgi:hypothetical protein